ncbi:obg family GTPase CgtA [Microdochium bolleyi]|uniref:Obg family GTPase CgtA n=1 Tax=Microdochium bolleyi TaxID=196109 RepID=A0A136IKN6_9PEZI|nr:obg family GTPase CgtA [Microdochium bolleyi]
MPPRCAYGAAPFLSFLYPSLFRPQGARALRSFARPAAAYSISSAPDHTSSSERKSTETSSTSSNLPTSRLNPPPDDYAITSFADKTTITVYAGGGGHGCISFLREAFLADGPANGGDGGHGGNIYIQATHSETSLNRVSRRGIVRAGRGKSGQGSSRGGARGEDVIIQVPVGTVVRELERRDPMVEEAAQYRIAREKAREHRKIVREAEAEAAAAADLRGDETYTLRDLPEAPDHPNLHKFMLYPGISHTERRNLKLPRLPRRERLYAQPDPPIHLDLSEPSPTPILLAAGGVGGLGNPHFVDKDRPRPLFATRGEAAVTMRLELELKLLADVGFVGLPNAGKSTLLRALTNSRARVGNWAFTTLQPNIGTVVLDNNKGRPMAVPKPKSPAPHAVINDSVYGSVVVTQPEQLGAGPEPRTRFTIADIPGLIEGAHLDRGLGMEFLRHVERAGVLAFVIDLSAGDAIKALKALWLEVGSYARMRNEEELEREIEERIDWQGDGGGSGSKKTRQHSQGQMMVADYPDAPGSEDGLHIAMKPWYVIATKGDLPGTQENFARLKEYLDSITDGREPHPSGVEDAWTVDCAAIPVSAINGHGVERIVHWTVGLLDD